VTRLRIVLSWTLLMIAVGRPGALAAGQPAEQPAAPAVEYVVRLPEPQTQMVSMSMTLRSVQAPVIEVSLPAWRPGRYVILDPAGTVRDVVAKSGRGAPLICEKIDKGSWMVQRAEDDETVVVEYRVYANSIADRTRHVDDTHAFLSPSMVFMYAPDYRGRVLRVKIEAPEGWRTATGLDPDPADPAWLTAANYDVLVDSPLEIGLHDSLTFEVEGVPHEIVVWTGHGPTPGYDRKALTEEFAKVILAEKAVFGEFPYSRYVFLIHCYPGGGGGTEHLNSTIMGTGTQTFETPEATRRFMGLVAHEYFHTWNVKQLRPAGLKPYHFQHENYTDLLWIAEGTTSYYSPLSLVRAGIVKPDDYLKTLGNGIEGYRGRPGSMVQSLAESSFDAWIKFSRATPDNVNSTVSFYDKGSLVSLLLDMHIREKSENRASLDTLMRDLYLAFPLSGPGYTTRDVIRAAERLTLGSVDAFFADYVDGVKPLDFESALATAGLEVVHEPARGAGKGGDEEGSDALKTGEPKEEPASPATGGQRAYIGLTLESRDGLAAVAAVLADGPAYTAGVIAGDQILALNGLRLRPGDLDNALKKVKPGESVRLSIFRYDVLREIEFKAEGRFDGKWVVRRIKSPTEQQRAVYESWLGQRWPGRAAAKNGADGQ